MDAKLFKILGEQRINELNQASDEKLKETIVTASQQKEEAKRELESNEAFKKAKEDVKALSGATKDLNKELNAVIKAAIQVLEARGKA